MIIDTEGTEPAIMESIDYNSCKIDFVQIECNSCNQKNVTRSAAGVPVCARQQELLKIMQSHGFVEAYYIEPIDIIYRRIA